MQTNLTTWTINEVDSKLIELSLIEDLGKPYQDITTKALFNDGEKKVRAKIISKQTTPIILCGLPVVSAILAKFCEQASYEINSDYHDGEWVEPNQTLLTLVGSPLTLLMLERTVLNFLQRLSAIASLTATYVMQIKHTNARILDTRKTSPGLRHLEKYAVQCGGGVNHRMGLYDAIMIKDTHIDLLGGMKNALDQLFIFNGTSLPVIVEVRNSRELKLVLNAGLNKITRVLLDNMSYKELRTCVNLCRGKVKTEASGNINLENVISIAECGVDFISIGKLTHSAGTVDLSMKCD